MANPRRTFREVRADVSEAAGEAKASLWSKLSTWTAGLVLGLETIAGTAVKRFPDLGYAELGNQIQTYLTTWTSIRADVVGVIVIITPVVAMTWSWLTSFSTQYRDVRAERRSEA